MTQPAEKLNLLVTCYMEPEFVEQIRQVDPRIHVIYEPGLVPTPRFQCDHLGHPLTRTPEDEARWRELLACADILLDLDKTHLTDLPELAPRVRWIQSTSTGIGPWVKELGYDRRMPDTVITVAGIHGRPLAEFAIMALLMHYKLAGVMASQKMERKFTRFTGTDAEGRTLAILGLGRNGTAVAQMARGIGMRVLGMDLVANPGVVDQFYPREALDELLAQAEALVIAMPGTPFTRGMIGARELALLPKGAYLVNVGRGSIVDEAAMLACLRSGQLSGAALDVFTQEPLPADSPFWDLPNVLISPHAASISDRENARITDVFCDNLRRYLDGRPLRNVLNMELLY
jgi:glyoxylate/hydroxypyruvate reductase